MRYCYNHPSIGATNVCEACGRGICAACTTHVDNHVYCRDCAVEERKNVVNEPVIEQSSPAPSAEPAAPAPAPTKPAEPAIVRPEASAPAPAPSKEEAKPAPDSTVAIVPSKPTSVAPKSAPMPPATPPQVPATAGGPGEKESLLAALMSFVIPGLGQIYNGQVKKGIALALIFYGLLVVIIGFIVVFALFGGLGAICVAPGLLFPALVLLFAVYDAYETAEKINRKVPTRDWLS